MWNILLSAYTRGFPAEGKKWLGAVSLRPIDIAHTGIEKNKKFLNQESFEPQITKNLKHKPEWFRLRMLYFSDIHFHSNKKRSMET